MFILRILIGIILLLAGRKLYWLFVAVVGFIVGFVLAEILFPQGSTWLLVLVGLAVGSICALLAVFINRLAIALVGFFGGGFLAIQLLAVLRVYGEDLHWVPFLIGGIIGTILAALFFDWALIIFSSLVGAFLIGSIWEITPTWANILISMLFLLGVVTQAGLLHWERKKSI
jgi:hypothetical protein